MAVGTQHRQGRKMRQHCTSTWTSCFVTCLHDLAEIVRRGMRHGQKGFADLVEFYRGDTIYVPPAGYFFISGQVARPGRYRLERGMTVEQAITLAGGFNKFAGENRLRVKRVVAGQPGEFQAQLDDRLEADDVLIVPESIFERPARLPEN